MYYQNAYRETMSYSVGGTGLLWDADNVYKIFIGGTKTTGVSLTLDKVITDVDYRKGLTAIKVYSSTDFLTVADSVPINNTLTCRMLGSGSSPVTGLPSNSLYFVEIHAISESTVFVNAYNVESGNRYYRRKASGTWMDWENKN